MTSAERARFDALLEGVIADLPERLHRLIDEVPVIVLDQPSPEQVRQLRADGLLEPDEDGSDLCGLHNGIGLTDRSVEDPQGWGGESGSAGPEEVHLFRRGIIDLAGGWSGGEGEQRVREEIRITLLHEIGHHFGLDEDDLDELGFA